MLDTDPYWNQYGSETLKLISSKVNELITGDVKGEAEEAEERAGLTEQAVAKVKSAARGAI